MSNINTVHRPGQANLAGVLDSNTLLQFTGEVLATYQAEAKLERFSNTRTITNGKSTTFSGIGTTTGRFYQNGTVVDNTNGNPPVATKTVTVDGMFIASAFLGDMDESIMHFDIRGPIARELGTALAIAADNRRLRTLVRGARARENWLAQRLPGSSGVRSTTVGTADGASPTQQTADWNRDLRETETGFNDVTILVRQLYRAARILTEKNCPMTDRFAVIRPSSYYALVSNPALVFSSDYGSGAGFDAARARVPMLADLELVMLQPQIFDESVGTETDVVTSPGPAGDGSDWTTRNNYRVDLRPTRFIASHKSALANVKLIDLQLQSEYSVRNQGTHFVARYAMGHDILRQEFCVESARSEGTTAATRGHATSASAPILLGTSPAAVTNTGNNGA